MSAPVSRALMTIACCCLGARRREWALAMRAELEVAIAEGHSFAFATGCLTAAWREMPYHAEGRLVLANYGLALGLLIPMAVFPFALALGFSSIVAGGANFDGALVSSVSRNPVLFLTQLSAVPCLLALWLLLGLAHLRLAWVVVERDWARVVRASAFIGATLVTLFILTATLALDVTLVTLQALAVAVELCALTSIAARQTRLVSNPA